MFFVGNPDSALTLTYRMFPGEDSPAEVQEYLLRDHLPDSMFFEWQGVTYRFNTRRERRAFARAAWSIKVAA